MFTVFSNKLLEIHLLGAEAGEEMWPKGRAERERGAPMGTRPWAPCAPALGTPHAPPRCRFSCCKTERYLLSLLPLAGNTNEKYYNIITYYFVPFSATVEPKLVACLNFPAKPLELFWFHTTITKITCHGTILQSREQTKYNQPVEDIIPAIPVW